jgi:hypothetical protein
MNPLHWTREHKLAWIVISATGTVFGVLVGFTHSPLFPVLQSWQMIVEWLSFPGSYWQWPAFSFMITGLTFYVVQLFRSSN